MKNSTEEKYRTYLLRIWCTEIPGQGWRASLQDPKTEQRIGFASLEQLFSFLIEQTESDAKGGGAGKSNSKEYHP